jgi:hypothetical protein
MASSAAAALRAPTHEEILAGMDSSIRNYLDQSSDKFVREYGRSKFHLTPKAVKDEKKCRAHERVVAEEKKKLQHLDWFGLTQQHIFETKINKSGDLHEVYERLHESFSLSSTKHLKWKKDLSYEYQPLPQIRKGFVSRFNSTGESDAIVVSLNQMLDEIYALCKSEIEAKIRAEQEKLSQMM